MSDDTAAFTVRAIEATETHDLRKRVLRPGANAGSVVFAEDAREDAWHAGAVDADGTIVAIASIYAEGRDGDPVGASWRVRGMAADPSMRRKGAGRAVLDACLEHASEQGAQIVWCNARTGAVPFYEAQGWHTLGEEFDIPGIGPHYVMERSLTA